MFMLDNDIMAGFPDGSFRPENSLTSAQFATILYRVAGEPDAAGLPNPFNDVRDGVWYTDAILWAVDAGIVDGIGGGRFGTTGHLTKQRLATLIHRWQVNADTVLPDTVEHEWPDIDNVADWALDAVKSLTAQGLFVGIPGNDFNPTAAATRAEIASVLFRLLNTR
jgi:hypothetical protein